MRALAALALSVALAAAAAAETKPGAAAAAKAVAPFLDGRTVAVLHVDVKALDVDALASEVQDLFKTDPDETARAKKDVQRLLRPLADAGVRDAFVVVSLADVPNQPPFAVFPLPGGGDAEALIDGLRRAVPGPPPGGGDRGFDFEEIRGAVVGGSPAVLRRLRGLKPEARPEVEQAFAGAGGGAAQLALVSTTDARRVLEEVMPTLPPQLGGGSVKVLTRGLRWGAARVDVKPRLGVRVTLQAADDSSAKEVHGLITKALEALGRMNQGRSDIPDLDKLAGLLTPRVAGDRLVLELDRQALAARLAPVVAKVERASERAQASNNLKQIGVALHVYHDANRSFPAMANYDRAGKPLLSWRVHLLPYVEYGALYKEFHLDEPWDSDHNKKLIARMPRTYAAPGRPKLAEAGKTTYLGVSAKDGMFPPGGRGVRIADVTDGASNTLFVVDVDDGHAAVWTKPEDLAVDPKDPLKGLGFRYGDGFLGLYVDGSVHFIAKAVSKDTLNALFTRNGGESVSQP
jgi:hypothetical protein